jgi:hypothetical protein
MNALNGIVSLVSFASTIIPKKKHVGECERKSWGNMEETYGNVWRHGGA